MTYRNHHFSPAPEDGAISLSLILANGTAHNQTIEWKAFTARGFTSTTDYMQSYWSGLGQENGQNKKKAQESRWSAPLLNNTVDGVGFYMRDGTTVVWYQNNFEPNDYQAYFDVVYRSLLEAQALGATRLIMDFSMNGGGDICLGRSMLYLLFPTAPNFTPTDLPGTPLGQNLSSVAATSNIFSTEWSP